MSVNVGVPIVLGAVDERAVLRYPGVINEEIDFAEMSHSALDQSAYIGGGRDVGRDGGGPTAGGGDLRLGTGGRLLVYIVDHDSTAKAGQQGRRRPPDPSSGPGDQGDAATEVEGVGRHAGAPGGAQVRRRPDRRRPVQARWSAGVEQLAHSFVRFPARSRSFARVISSTETEADQTGSLTPALTVGTGLRVE